MAIALMPDAGAGNYHLHALLTKPQQAPTSAPPPTVTQDPSQPGSVNSSIEQMQQAMEAHRRLVETTSQAPKGSVNNSIEQMEQANRRQTEAASHAPDPAMEAIAKDICKAATAGDGSECENRPSSIVDQFDLFGANGRSERSVMPSGLSGTFMY